MNKIPLTVIFSVSALVLLGSLIGVEANISSTAPSMVEVTPPSSVLYHDTESNTQIIAFVEKQNHVLTMPISVDITTSGTSSPPGSLTPGVIPANTAVNSYFIHLDPPGTGPTVSLSGSITLDEKIIGVIVSPSNLDASDGELGFSMTSYPVGRLRGLESASPDFITVDIDLATVSVRVLTNTQVDQARIITEASVPLTVGGDFYPVDNVSLVLAYGLVNSWWMAPTAVGIGVGIYLVKRRF